MHTDPSAQTPANPEQTRSVEHLQSLIAEGAEPQYLFFWGPLPEVPDTLDASCLCNWYPAPFVAEDRHYATSEHYLMAEKARMFGDDEILALILDAETPLEAKAFGRRVAGFDESRWIERRVAVAIDGNLHKFSQHPALADYLRATRPRVLVEASPWDSLWGIGVNRDHPQASNALNWRGRNLLGFALMEVRARLATTDQASAPD